MKYDCSEEFNLNEIYAKLVGGSTPSVAMSEFFAPPLTLSEFQQAMSQRMRELRE